MKLVPDFPKDSDAVEDGKEKKWAPKHGPQAMRFVTNGQIRRAEARRLATQRRKATKRYRKVWFTNRWATAVLRERVRAIETLPGNNPERFRIEQLLERQYGSVAAAQEHYAQIEAEKALQRLGRSR